MRQLKRLPNGEVDWDSITISDDFMFKNVMSIPEVSKTFLEELLGIPIKEVKVVTDHALDLDIESKGVRYDVVVDDGTGRVFEIEMQKTSAVALERRIRYYLSMLDLRMLQKGKSYKNLGDAYVIFVCDFDPFNKGELRYTFERRCTEVAYSLGDGTTGIVLNAKGVRGEASEVIRDFLDYIAGITNERSGFVRRVDAEVRRIRRRDDWRRDRMTLEMIIDEEREEAAKAAAEAAAKAATEEATRKTEERYGRLVEAMVGSGRAEELRSAARDGERIKQLYAEFGIS